MVKRWTLVLVVLVGLVLVAPAQVPPVIGSVLLANKTSLLVFRNVLAEVDERSWQMGFGVGPCREIRFRPAGGMYKGHFRFQSLTTPLVCQVPFTYESVAQVPAVPPDRFTQGLNAIFLPVNAGLAIESETCLKFMEHVLALLPAELTDPLDSGLAFVGLRCAEVGSRVEWTIEIGTQQSVPRYTLTVSADVLPSGSFGRLEFNR